MSKKHFGRLFAFLMAAFGVFTFIGAACSLQLDGALAPLAVFSQSVEDGQCFTAKVSGGQLQWEGDTPPIFLEFSGAELYADNSWITVRFCNQASSGMLMYGQSYTLSFRENEDQEWGEPPVDLFPSMVRSFESLGYFLSAGETEQHTHQLSIVPLPAGQYRFQTPVSFPEAITPRSHGDPWMLGLDFEISN